MAATELIHLSYDGNFQLETDAKVILCKVIFPSGEEEPLSSAKIELQLDKTSMHPLLEIKPNVGTTASPRMQR
jgi:hypothetical protein